VQFWDSPLLPPHSAIFGIQSQPAGESNENFVKEHAAAPHYQRRLIPSVDAGLSEDGSTEPCPRSSKLSSE